MATIFRRLLLATLVWCAAGAATAQQVQLTCNVGPVHRTFGGASWIVYGCDDGKSLVVASDAGNPASPFYFVLAWSDAGYGVSGEGNGNREASAAAFAELRALTRAQIEALYSDAQVAAATAEH